MKGINQNKRRALHVLKQVGLILEEGWNVNIAENLIIFKRSNSCGGPHVIVTDIRAPLQRVVEFVKRSARAQVQAS